MTMEEAKALAAADFSKLSTGSLVYPQDDPLRDDGESLMDFIKTGAEKLKSKPKI